MTKDRALKKAIRARMARTGEQYSTARRNLLTGPGGSDMPDSALRQLLIGRIVAIPGSQVALPGPTLEHYPGILLREVDAQQRGVLVLVGQAEAHAIWSALRRLESRRPTTHDLLVTTITQLGAVSGVVLSLENEVYSATILTDVEGESQSMDARASDALAVVLRLDPVPPIWMPTEQLMSLAAGLDDLRDYEPEPVMWKVD